jgi:glycosyltransferase involved in cell wall biosynthesis
MPGKENPQRPKFSIITPVFNGEGYLRGCRADVLGFHVQDWEWIIVNDGSTDGTESVCRELEEGDPRIRVVSYPDNRGRGHARNRAIAQARGEWIVILDADDHSMPTRLDFIADNPAPDFDWLYSPVVLARRQTLEVYGGRRYTDNELNRTKKKSIHPSLIMRTDIAKELRYRELRTVGGIGEDVRLLMMLSLKYRGHFHDRASVIYCEDSEVNLRKAFHSNAILFRTCLEIIFKHPELVRAADALRAVLTIGVKLLVFFAASVLPGRDALYMRSISRRVSSPPSASDRLAAEEFVRARALGRGSAA